MAEATAAGAVAAEDTSLLTAALLTAAAGEAVAAPVTAESKADAEVTAQKVKVRIHTSRQAEARSRAVGPWAGCRVHERHRQLPLA